MNPNKTSLKVPSLLRVHRLHASSDYVPGLRFAIRDGTAILEGQKVPDMVLWSDTAPAEVEVNIVPKRKKIAEVMLWNYWRYENVTHAWLVNSGMLVEESENAWILRCNSEPNKSRSFDDLVIEVNLTPEAKP